MNLIRLLYNHMTFAKLICIALLFSPLWGFCWFNSAILTSQTMNIGTKLGIGWPRMLWQMRLENQEK